MLSLGYDYIALGHIHKPLNIDGGSAKVSALGEINPIPHPDVFIRKLTKMLLS